MIQASSSLWPPDGCRLILRSGIVKQSASRKVSLGCLPKVNLDILVEEEEFKEKGSKHEVTSG